MSKTITVILISCLAGLLIGFSYKNIKAQRWKRFVLNLIILSTVVLLLNRLFGFPHAIEIETKGAVEEGIAIVFCYICMVIGMVAQYFFGQGEQSRTKFKFEIVSFLMPICASPIVFIPLLAILEDIPMSGAFTKSKLMIYFVAFQNGFFWKDQFDRQRRRLSGSSRETQVQA